MAISAQQYAELQRRLAGGKADASKAKSSKAGKDVPVGATISAEIILGLDPSLRGTGYGLIRVAKPRPVLLACGTLHCPAGWERSPLPGAHRGFPA